MIKRCESLLCCFYENELQHYCMFEMQSRNNRSRLIDYSPPPLWRVLEDVLSYVAANWRASRDVLHAGGHKKEETERLVKQRLPSVSTGRPQLLRTNIRHAVAAYGLMVTVQSEVRRSAVRNAARKTARVISAALCAPPNDRPTGPLAHPPSLPPSQPFRGMSSECRGKYIPQLPPILTLRLPPKNL